MIHYPGVLGVVLGAIGMHRFYLGHVKSGVFQLFVTLLTYGFGASWGIVDGIRILSGADWRDGQGKLLRPYETQESDADVWVMPEPVQLSPKSRVVAGLLGIFLEALGAHRFYLGNRNIGLAQLILTFVTMGYGAAWGIVEGLMILGEARWKDRKGLLLAYYWQQRGTLWEPEFGPIQYSDKSRLLTGVLGVVVGFLGLHRLYLGYITMGVTRLALALGCIYYVVILPITSIDTEEGLWSWAIFLPLFLLVLVLLSLWGFVEGMIILTGGIWRDAEGRPLRSYGLRRAYATSQAQT